MRGVFPDSARGLLVQGLKSLVRLSEREDITYGDLQGAIAGIMHLTTRAGVICMDVNHNSDYGRACTNPLCFKSERIYVLAGSFKQFVDWCREHKIDHRDPKKVCYISEAFEQLRGLHEIQFVRTGTWYSQRNVDETLDLLRARGAREVEI